MGCEDINAIISEFKEFLKFFLAINDKVVLIDYLFYKDLLCLKNISMRVKLLFFPFMFILIVVASGAVYGFILVIMQIQGLKLQIKTEDF